MQAILQSVRSNIHNQQHLKQMVKKVSRTIILSSESGEWHLTLSDAVHDKKNSRIFIKGPEEILLQALKGEIPLRQLQRLERISIQGNFREILLLESLFILSKERRNKITENL